MLLGLITMGNASEKALLHDSAFVHCLYGQPSLLTTGSIYALMQLSL